jgi:hypothetical protein
VEFLVCVIEVDDAGSERFRWFKVDTEDARQAAALVTGHVYVYGEQVPPGTTINVMPMFKGPVKVKRLETTETEVTEVGDSYEFKP